MLDEEHLDRWQTHQDILEEMKKNKLYPLWTSFLTACQNGEKNTIESRLSDETFKIPEEIQQKGRILLWVCLDEQWNEGRRLLAQDERESRKWFWFIKKRKKRIGIAKIRFEMRKVWSAYSVHILAADKLPSFKELLDITDEVHALSSKLTDEQEVLKWRKREIDCCIDELKSEAQMKRVFGGQLLRPPLPTVIIDPCAEEAFQKRKEEEKLAKALHMRESGSSCHSDATMRISDTEDEAEPDRNSESKSESGGNSQLIRLSEQAKRQAKISGTQAKITSSKTAVLTKKSSKRKLGTNVRKKIAIFESPRRATRRAQ